VTNQWAEHDGETAPKAKEKTMNCKLLTSSVAALALLALAGAAQPALAKGHGSHGGHGGHFHGMGQFSRPHHVFVHRFRHHRRFAVVGLYPYAYGDGCYWLKRRALYTGSPYWWRRYYACRHGYY
jgi:hypothetical protein